MASIHFKKHLIHQCMVQRNTPSQSSSGELIESWTDVGNVNCRFVDKEERIAQEGLGLMMMQRQMLLMDTGENIQEEDRVIDVILRADSSVVDAGPFSIESLLQRNTSGGHHLSAVLERIE